MSEEKKFNPHEHLSKIKTKQGLQDYLQIQWRLVWFREQCEKGTIETELVHLDTEKQLAVFKAMVTDGNGAIATGHGSESARDFGDWIEKAETKAIGRALAGLGYGTQFTGDELNEGDRIADSPVPIKGSHGQDGDTPASREEMDALNKLRLKLGMPLSNVKHTRATAKAEYTELLAEWNEMHTSGRAS